MPRRSTRQPDPEVTEKRVTRRSLHRAAKVDPVSTKEDETGSTTSSRASRSRSSPSPSPAKSKGAARGRSASGRGRGKGRGGKGKGKSRSPRGRKPKKKEAWESDEEEEEYVQEVSPAEDEGEGEAAGGEGEGAGGDAEPEKMEEEDADVPPTKARSTSRGRKSDTATASPAGRKGRASGGTPGSTRRSGRAKKAEEEIEDEAEEGEGGEEGGRRSRQTRGAPKSPAPRRSSRGATKAASEKLSLLAAQENEEIDDEEKEEEMVAAEAEEEASESPEKAPPTQKRKIDEVEADDGEDTKGEAEAKKAKVETEAEKADEEGKEEKEEEAMDVEDSKADDSKAEKEEPTEPAAAVSSEAKDAEADSKPEEAKPSQTDASPKDDKESPKKESVDSAAAMETATDAPSEEKPAPAEVPVAISPVKLSSHTEEEAPEKEFVMVQKDDVPAADSAEVQQALPQHPEPAQASAEPSSQADDKPTEKPSEKPTEKPTEAADQGSVATEVTEPPVPAPAPAADTQQTTAQPIINNQQQSSQSDHTANNGETPTDATQKSDVQTPPAPVTNNSHGSDSTNDVDSDPLLHRQFCPNPSVQGNLPEETKRFTLATYNILDECHAIPHASAYPWTCKEKLTNKERSTRQMQELKYLDADIVCLQEVGVVYFTDVLKPAMKTLGYDGDFIKRAEDKFTEGEATFWRSSQFELLQSRGLVLSNVACADVTSSGIEQASSIQAAIAGPGVAMVTQLKCIATGQKINVANIHVMHYDFGSPRPDLQCMQAACAIRQLVSTSGGADQPHIICGDFNSTPGSTIYQLTQEGYLNDQSMSVLQGLNKIALPDGNKTSLVNMWWKGFQHTSNTLKSAYNTVFNQEPISSRFPNDGISRNVDFVWYSSGSLQVLGALRTAPEAHIKAGIPNDTYPSDHVSLKVQLAFQ